MYNTRLKPIQAPLNVKAPTQTHAQLGSLQLIKTIKTGKSCKIKLGRDVVTQKQFAIKILKSDMAPTLAPSLDYEAEIQAGITQGDHPNLLKQVNYFPNVEYTKKDGTTKRVYALVSEFAEEGDLYDYLETHGPLSEGTSRYYFEQLINAIEYLHNRGIAHMNLRLENLLLTHDLVLKLADFSFTNFVNNNGSLLSTELFPSKALDFSAPEFVQKQHTNYFINDLFACGIILFTLVVGYPPFSIASLKDFHYKLIINQQFNAFWKQHEQRRRKTFSNEFKELINSMLAFQSTERLTIAEIKSHPWYLNTKPSFHDIKEEHDNNIHRLLDLKSPMDSDKSQMRPDISQPKASFAMKFAMKGIQLNKKY
mgnify:CR=1 FL=1